MKSRRKATLILAAVLVSLCLAAPARAWDEAKFKSQVEELFAQVAAGFVKKDVDAILATGVPQGVIKYRDGRSLAMSQWREGVARELKDWQDVSSRFVVEKVWPKGKDQAGVLYREHNEFSRLSDPGHRYAIDARFRGLLTKTPQGWRFLEFTELYIIYSKDGKLLKDQGALKAQPKPQAPAQS